MELVQLLHEVVLGVQATCGVDKEVIRLARLCGSDGVVRHGRGIRTIRAGNDFDLEARAPEFELFNGGSPERVARGQQRMLILRLNEVRELRADGDKIEMMKDVLIH